MGQPSPNLPSQKPVLTSLTRFFSNKGEVAGIFTVVGLAAIAILITAITTIIRRRRAKQFDKNTAEAAMQAAATSHNAGFADDDDDGYGRANDNPYTGYSAESHGTYGQPAMSHMRRPMS
jgi:hypothetical protein